MMIDSMNAKVMQWRTDRSVVWVSVFAVSPSRRTNIGVMFRSPSLIPCRILRPLCGSACRIQHEDSPKSTVRPFRGYGTYYYYYYSVNREERKAGCYLSASFSPSTASPSSALLRYPGWDQTSEIQCDIDVRDDNTLVKRRFRVVLPPVPSPSKIYPSRL